MKLIKLNPNMNRLRLLLQVGALVACSCFLFSCKSSKSITKEEFLYFQNGLDSIKNVQLKEPTIHAYDVLSIQVTSTSPIQEQIAPFNPPDKTAGYLVNSDGNIEVPVVNKKTISKKKDKINPEDNKVC